MKIFKTKFAYIESLEDFTFKGCQEMIQLSDYVYRNSNSETNDYQVSELRKIYLISKCSKTKRYGLNFFNSINESNLRLRIGEYEFLFMKDSQKIRYCICCYITRSSSKRILRTY